MKSFLLPIFALLFLAMLFAGCTTQTPVPPPVTTVPVPATTVPVPTATAAPLTDPALTGTWNLKGAMVSGGTSPRIPNVQITAMFNSDGTLTGFGGCNNYFGSYTLTGQTTQYGKTISISDLGSTKMYCAETSDLELTYLNLLRQTKTYSITTGSMLLTTGNADQLSYDKATP
jgi:heat shock protein HslJ